MVGPAISDHVLLRLLERSGKLDLEALRTALQVELTRAFEAGREMSAADLLIRRDDLTFVVRGETVTTVIFAPTPGERYQTLRPRGKKP